MKKQAKIGVFLACSFLFIALAGCDKLNLFGKPKEVPKKISQPLAVKGTVVAKVNNYPVTLEEVNQELDSYNASVPEDKPEMKITTREQKVNYLKNEVVRRLLLYQAALAKGLDRKEEVVKVMEKTKQDLLVIELVRQEAEKIDVSSSEIEEYYNTYKEQLKDPEERQVREIVVSSEQDAKDILILLLQAGDFAALARERSIAPSAKDGGDLGFIQKGKKSAQFDSAVFSDAVDTGKISNIFKVPEGYCIVKIEGKRGGKQKSLSELWDDIKRGLTFVKQQQKIDSLISNLSKEAKIEIYEGEIK